jgi:hypothetical protein
MSTFSIKDNQVDVESIMATIRKRIEEKRKGLYTEQEIEEIAQMKLDAPLAASEFNSDFVAQFRARDAGWNYRFEPETIYASSRGGAGALIRLLRRVFHPLLKLLFNPNPIISSLSRQADLNRYYVQLLHNMAVELTKLNLEVTDLKARVRGLGGRVEFQARREKTLEDVVTGKEPATPAEPAGEAEKRRRPRGSRRGWRRRRGERRPESEESRGEARGSGSSGGAGGNGPGRDGGDA